MTKRPKKTELLARRIAERAKEEFGIDLRNVWLRPATGAWRTNAMLDVQPWEGYAEWHDERFSSPLTVSLGSWDTMTDLLRKGFTLEQEQPCSFELRKNT